MPDLHLLEDAQKLARQPRIPPECFVIVDQSALSLQVGQSQPYVTFRLSKVLFKQQVVHLATSQSCRCLQIRK
jgi:hypothetical protein